MNGCVSRFLLVGCAILNPIHRPPFLHEGHANPSTPPARDVARPFLPDTDMSYQRWPSGTRVGVNCGTKAAASFLRPFVTRVGCSNSRHPGEQGTRHGSLLFAGVTRGGAAEADQEEPALPAMGPVDQKEARWEPHGRVRLRPDGAVPVSRRFPKKHAPEGDGTWRDRCDRTRAERPIGARQGPFPSAWRVQGLHTQP